MMIEIVVCAVAIVFVWVIVTWDSDEPGSVTRDIVGWSLVGIVTLLTAIAVPSFVKARNTSQQNACIGNMRIIDSGKEQAGMAYQLTDGDRISTLSVNEYVKGSTVPICPAGGTYTYGRVGEQPDCNINTPTSHLLP